MTVREWMDEHPDEVCMIKFYGDETHFIPRESEFDAIVTDVYGSYWAPTILEINRPSPTAATSDKESLINENERLEELMKSQKAYIEELEKLNTSLGNELTSKEEHIKWLKASLDSELKFSVRLTEENKALKKTIEELKQDKQTARKRIKDLIDICVDNAYKIEFLKEEQMGTLQTMDELFDTIDELQTELRGKDDV